MASALRSVAHEDRLSLVEHLTELRVRIVICLVALAATTALCMWQNQRVLDILNAPLEQTVKEGSADPIQQGARWDQLAAGLMNETAEVNRLAAADTDDAQLKAALTKLAATNERVAKLAPEVQARKPVTLGVSEPFLQTLKVSVYAGLLLALPLILFQIYAFVLPAFSPREKQIALPAMLGIPFLFIGGV